MNTAVLTIVTKSHLHYALSLMESVTKNAVSSDLFIYVVDISDKSELDIEVNNQKIHLIFKSSFKSDSDIAKAYEKYYKHSLDKVRWTLKPLLLIELLSIYAFDSILYFDADMYVYGNLDFLFKLLENHSIILTPHWRDSSPNSNPDNFIKNFTEGLYNGGFIGASKSGIPALKWWGNTCLFKCEQNPQLGIYDDQKYLDLMPVIFPNVKMIDHQGCNVAVWNFNDCERSKVGDEVLINGVFPVVFIHYTKGFNFEILFGNDRHLDPYFKAYSDTIKKYKPSEDMYEKTKFDYPYHIAYLHKEKKTSVILIMKNIFKQFIG